MKVFVVTNPELGWDCIVEVYQAETKQEVKQKLIDDDWADCMKEVDENYVIHEKNLIIL